MHLGSYLIAHSQLPDGPTICAAHLVSPFHSSVSRSGPNTKPWPPMPAATAPGVCVSCIRTVLPRKSPIDGFVSEPSIESGRSSAKVPPLRGCRTISICRRSKLTCPDPLIATSEARRCNGPNWTMPSFKVPTPKRHVTGTRPCFLRNTAKRSVEAPSIISLAMLPPVTAITACPWAVAKAPSSPLFARCRFRRAGEFASNPPARDAKQGSNTRKIRFGHAGIQRNAVAVGFNRFHLRFNFAAI